MVCWVIRWMWGLMCGSAALIRSRGQKTMRHRTLSAAVVAVIGFAILGARAGAAPPAAGRIAFVSNRDGGSNQIYVMNVDGSHVTRVATPVNAQHPTFSSDGRTIAFVSYPVVSDIANRKGEIYSMNVDGSHLTRLTSLAREVDYPAFSPDGRRIAFGAGGQIYIMNVDGSGLVRLTSLPGGTGHPAFCPNGRCIAFAHWDPPPSSAGVEQARPQIYIMYLGGSHQERLTNLPGGAGEPAFSPDGHRIVFSSDRAGLYTMSADGSHLRFLPTGAEVLSPKFSPDGRKIAFSYYDTSEYRGVAGIWQIYIMGEDGSHLTRLTNVRAFNMDPVFAP